MGIWFFYVGFFCFILCVLGIGNVKVKKIYGFCFWGVECIREIDIGVDELVLCNVIVL